MKCHADCEYYQQYKAKLDQERKKRHQEVAVFCYEIDQKNKALKNKHSRGMWKRRKNNR